MINDAQNGGAPPARRVKPPRMVGISVIREGTPEHAEMIAQDLNLPLPPQPETPSELESTTDPAPTCDRHGRKCGICAHPLRDELEQLFLDWHRPSDIAHGFDVSIRTLYRHAHATGLNSKRQGMLRSVLDRILEGADQAKVTGDCIIRAVRAYSCLGPDNKWTEPPAHVIVSSASVLKSANGTHSIEVAPKELALAASPQRRPPRKRALKPQVLIDTTAIRKPRNSLKTKSRR
jgi:hypothetical protein